MKSVNQQIERRINNWCYRNKVPTRLPLWQKEYLYESKKNPNHAPSEKTILAMLKSIPNPSEHKKPKEYHYWNVPAGKGWVKSQ